MADRRRLALQTHVSPQRLANALAPCPIYDPLKVDALSVVATETHDVLSIAALLLAYRAMVGMVGLAPTLATGLSRCPLLLGYIPEIGPSGGGCNHKHMLLRQAARSWPTEGLKMVAHEGISPSLSGCRPDSLMLQQWAV